MLVAKDYVVCRHELAPGLHRFFVQGRTVLGAALEHCCVQLRLVDLVNLREQFPGPCDGFCLEIVPEAPVSEHLEHRVMPSVVSHCFEVVVLSADPEAFLRIGGPLRLRNRVAQEYILELVHSGIREHQGRIVLYDHRGRRYYGMSFGSKEIQELLSNLFGGVHISINQYKRIIRKIITFFAINRKITVYL